MTQINRWFVRAASVLAVAVVCSCASTSTPDNSSIQNTSEIEAHERHEARLAADDAAIKSAEDEEARFEEVAGNYRALAVKPRLPEQLPEAARRFAVQAEAAVDDKDFDAAEDLYKRALVIAPWWPEGHYDRAIVLSEIDQFPGAIIEMKRYLLLVPDALNARAAQDDIYKWDR